MCDTIASDALPPRKPPGPRMINITPMPAIGHRGLGAGEGDAVVGGTDHQRVAAVAVAIERIQHRPHATVKRTGAGNEGGHVAARLGHIGQVRGRPDVVLVALQRLEELPVGLEEPDRHEERLGRRVAQQVDCDRGDVVDPAGVDLDHIVVADLVRPLGDVLLADQRRVVPGVAQRVHHVVAVVVQRPAAVGQADHAVGVGVLAGQADTRGWPSRSRRRRTPCETACLPGRAPGSAGSGSRGRRAAHSGRCHANAGRGCSDGSRGAG